MKTIGLVVLFASAVAWAFIRGQANFHCGLVGWSICALAAILCALMAAVYGRGPAALAAGVVMVATAISPASIPLAGGMLVLPAVWVLLRGQSGLTDSIWPWRLLGVALFSWCAWSLYGWFEYALYPATAEAGYLSYLNGISGRWPEENLYRLNNTPLGHANYTSGYGVLMVPILGGLMAIDRTHRGWRTLWMLALVTALGVVCSGGSRAAVPALLGGAFAAAILVPTRTGSGWARHRVKVLAALLVFGAAVFLALPGGRAWLFNSTAKAYSDEIRHDYVLSAVEMLKSAPLSGVGAGAIALNYGAFPGERGDHPSCYQVHCTPAQWAAEYGIGGIALFAAMIVAAWVGLRRATAPDAGPLRVGLAVAVVAYGLFSLFDYQLNLVPFAALLAIASAGAMGPARAGSSRSCRIPIVVLFTGAAILVSVRVGLELGARRATHRAAAQFAAGDTAGGLASLTDAVRRHPASPIYSAMLSAHLGVSPMSTQAEADVFTPVMDAGWLHAIAAAPNAPFVDAEAGIAWLGRDPLQAERLLLQALNKNPKLPSAWMALSQAYQFQGRVGDAAWAVAMGSLIAEERIFSPRIITGELGGGMDAVLIRYRSVVAAYLAANPDDKVGQARLNKIIHHAEAWYGCKADALRFIKTYPDWSSSAGWKHMRERLNAAGAQKDSLDAILAYREILGASVYAYLRMDIRIGGAEALRRQLLGIDTTWKKGRVLEAHMDIPVFGYYLGDSSLGTLPSAVVSEDDLFALLFVYENDPIRPHLRTKFFADQLATHTTKKAVSP